MEDFQKCSVCEGGIVRCEECAGTGKDKEKRACLTCRGRGINHCTECNGHGSVPIIPNPPVTQSTSSYIQDVDEQLHEERRKRSLDEYYTRQEQKRIHNRNKVIQIIISIFIIAAFLLIRHYSPDIKDWFNKSAGSLETSSTNQKAINAASTLLEQNLKSPSSMKYISRTVVDQSPPYYLVHLVVDSDNEFGAKVRTSVLASIELSTSDQFEYNPLTSIQEASTSPLPIEIDLAKRLNNWPGINSNDNNINLSQDINLSTDPKMNSSVEADKGQEEANSSTSEIFSMNQLYSNNTTVSDDVIVSPNGHSLVEGSWEAYQQEDLKIPIRYGNYNAEFAVEQGHPNSTNFRIYIPDLSIANYIDYDILDEAIDEFDDLEDGYKIHVAVHDFNQDGFDEIVLVASNSIQLGVAVFSFNEESDFQNNPMKQVLKAEGQSKVILNENILITPIGSNDFWKFIYQNGQLIRSGSS